MGWEELWSGSGTGRSRPPWQDLEVVFLTASQTPSPAASLLTHSPRASNPQGNFPIPTPSSYIDGTPPHRTPEKLPDITKTKTAQEQNPRDSTTLNLNHVSTLNSALKNLFRAGKDAPGPTREPLWKPSATLKGPLDRPKKTPKP